jgi:hypothetical protein
VRTKIRPTVPRGTLIVAQSQVQYNGLSAPLFSNVVTLLVVEAAPTASAPASQVKATLPPTLTAVPPSATSAAAAGAATATQGATTQSVAAPSATAAPNAAAPKPTAAPSAAAGGTSQLPDTSTGVPLFGFVLLGLTMLVRTVRLHRARERV